MSRRPIEEKKLRRLRKALRPGVPVYFDLVEWLVDHHRPAPHRRLTKKQARQMLLDGRVRVGANRVGRLEIELLGQKKWVVDPLLPAKFKSELLVTAK